MSAIPAPPVACATSGGGCSRAAIGCAYQRAAIGCALRSGVSS